MLYNTMFYAALAVMCVGFMICFARWFFIELGYSVQGYSFFEKIFSMAKVKLRFFASFSGLVSILKVIIVEVLLQKRLFLLSPLRWGFHMLIFYGFTLLVLFHVFDQSIALLVFPDYLSTLNPWMFLRNLMGFFVFAGVTATIVRKIKEKQPLPVGEMPGANHKNGICFPGTGSLFSYGSLSISDIMLPCLILMIVLSGFFLEATLIISRSVYEEMVMDYSDLDYTNPDDEEDLSALSFYWEKEYGVILSYHENYTETFNAKNFDGNFGEELRERGAELNEQYCIDCHSRPVNAFISYPVSKLIAHGAFLLDSIRADVWLWYIHVLSSFLFMALVPFSRFLHLLSTPLSLAMNRSGMDFSKKKPTINRSKIDFSQKKPAINRSETDFLQKISEPALSLKRSLELDACVQCSACSDVCSVAPIFRTTDNPDIFPSEKMRSIKNFLISAQKPSHVNRSKKFSGAAIVLRFFHGATLQKFFHGDAFNKTLHDAALRLTKGSYICTDCFRCNEVCPAGIDLKGIWESSRKRLDIAGFFPPHKSVNMKNTMEWAEQYKKDCGTKALRKDKRTFYKIPSDPGFFSNCVQCSICSNVCPVVEISRSHSHDPGLSPQQVMNLLRLELRDVAMFSSMVWNCTTCYMCQEHCPQGIEVADILYNLRNLASNYLGKE
ncbi:conserved membrane hypothetical protein [Desulfamplus magnetovallimortis]|uniref:4Fe-4S ferredoxin-type domain-containing protein n=1 Tax=Desulfamplus magnetovallimortis TaxID=1246637 RepID=A0A1W1HHD4_9BACT|nr:4Fe-4S dicluster domain-containing protein [Desulfamplus magnetovallimortis]SLM31792.1 conserved membrane hypothetical protein [Desulfamplus magnetovallimortis]